MVPPATTTAPTTQTAPAPTTTFDYQNLTVEQILNKFQQSLEADSLVYLRNAKTIAERGTGRHQRYAKV